MPLILYHCFFIVLVVFLVGVGGQWGKVARKVHLLQFRSRVVFAVQKRRDTLTEYHALLPVIRHASKCKWENQDRF